MEYYWSLYNNDTGGTNGSAENGVRGHIGNLANHAWDQSSWDLIANSYPNNSHVDYNGTGALNNAGVASHAPRGSQVRNPDPDLTCLKLGKRHCFDEDVVVCPEIHVAGKKGKACGGGGPSAPRCQVEGCESVLANARDYHRRHKVCEMHAKAPRVVVHGTEQRFCQQCSRFHAVGEFDESKRSCRRRLAGHNERRRKSSQEQHSQDIQMMGTGKYPHLLSSSSSNECALSLLSSSSSTNYNTPWNYISPSSSTDDLPARCSAALRELIAENRASVLASRQILTSNHFQNSNNSYKNSYGLGLGCDGPNISDSGGHVTLDLMQKPDSGFGLLSVHHHKDSEEGNGEDCSDLWRVPLGY
ncbi:hypothetical protein CASFOL_039880 [Castilleja foliolosa]|uniref:SBP-type domain-containing protein n=1 Tax=Castilleja foliolosa TaxID=1961234 RepID=A0ABD3BGG2_9LAMI